MKAFLGDVTQKVDMDSPMPLVGAIAPTSRKDRNFGLYISGCLTYAPFGPLTVLIIKK